jgi:hypothetical protein
MSDRRPEVLSFVAFLALQGRVLVLQRKIRLAMVEATVREARWLPATGCVTLLAVTCKRTSMGILVARLAALVEAEVLVLHMPALRRQTAVALGAGDFRVQSRQWVGSFVVGKTRRPLPCLKAVATVAVLPKISPVLVSMAIRTFL